MYPPPPNTLHTVTDPAFFKYSLTVWGTNVSELKVPNFLSYSAKLLTTVGINAHPCSVGPIIAAPIYPTPWGKNERSFSLVKTPGEIICSAILCFIL